MAKFYLVGGAVRDMLLGNKPKDRDYVVVGSNVTEMLANGFEKVGADFPVFLKNGNEYALARTERKNGQGYLGFEVAFDENVTLEQDLMRRDLTVNSVAYDMETDTYVDPFGGAEDLKNKVLRHTSEAFRDDPVRVLRVARFMARFGADWKVAPETKVLMADMAKKGVLNELTSERVWKELSRALMEPHARLFFDTLLETDTLHVLFPEVYRLKAALESRRWHPEGDAYEHTMLVLMQAVAFGYDLTVRFAALVHDFGKGLTPVMLLPKHHGHDVAGVPVVEAFANRLSVPAQMTKTAKLATRYHMYGHNLRHMKAKTFVDMFETMRAFTDDTNVEVLHKVFQVDRRGRLGSHNDDVTDLDYFLEVHKAAKSVKFQDVFPDGCTDVEKLKTGLRNARVNAVAKVPK